MALYVILHFASLELHPFIAFKSALAILLTIAANTGIESRLRPLTRPLALCVGGLGISLLDEWLVPELAGHVRVRYLLPLTTAAYATLIQRKSFASVWNAFLGLTTLFLSVHLLYAHAQRIDFITEKTPSNPVYDSLRSQLDRNVPVTLVLADGYPSGEILENRYGTRMDLESMLPGYSYRRLQTRYTSTPISVANLLFGAVFAKEDMSYEIRGRETEIELVHRALDSSSLKKLLADRNPKWASILFDEEESRVLGLPWWRRLGFHSLFDRLYVQLTDTERRQNTNIRRFNANLLADYRKTLADSDGDRRFIFLHMMTFHEKGIRMERQVVYADSLIVEAARLTPKTRKFILFSDHGSRDPGLDVKEMRSGILMTSPQP